MTPCPKAPAIFVTYHLQSSANNHNMINELNIKFEKLIRKIMSEKHKAQLSERIHRCG